MPISDFAKRLKGAATGTSGSKRMLMVIPGAAIVAGGVLWLSSGNQEIPQSVSPTINPMRTVQGGVAPSPEMNNALATADNQRIKQAEDFGRSVIPTVRANDSMLNDGGKADRNPADDLGTPIRPAPPVAPPVVVAPAMAPPLPQQVMAQAGPDPMVEQFRGALQQMKVGYPPASVTYFAKGNIPPKDLSGLQAQTAAAVNPALLDPASGIRIPLPGTIVYAEMVSSANSDSPGPVVARIVQGELAGATLVGSFQTQRDALYIQFRTLSMGTTREGEEINRAIQVNAVAVDSNTVGTGVASDIDRHLLQNVGVATAAAFAQGFGQAIAQSGQQISTSLGGVVVANPVRTTREQLLIASGTAGGAAGQALQQAFGNRPTTVTVDRGTPVGILFLPNGNL